MPVGRKWWPVANPYNALADNAVRRGRIPFWEYGGLNPILPFLGGRSDAACRVVILPFALPVDAHVVANDGRWRCIATVSSPMPTVGAGSSQREDSPAHPATRCAHRAYHACYPSMETPRSLHMRPQPLRQGSGEYERLQQLVIRGKHLLPRAAPLRSPLVEKSNPVANLEHRVHIVGVDHGGNPELVGNPMD